MLTKSLRRATSVAGAKHTYSGRCDFRYWRTDFNQQRGGHHFFDRNELHLYHFRLAG